MPIIAKAPLRRRPISMQDEGELGPSDRGLIVGWGEVESLVSYELVGQGGQSLVIREVL